jgi:hypothetical protein
MLALALVFGLAGIAHATNACVLGAHADFKACQAGCKSDFQDEAAICRGHDPVCAQTCRDGRDECSDPIIQANLTDCLDQCPAMDTARAACKAQYGCGGQANPCGFNPQYIACLNPAQTAAFQCRNLCHDAFKLNVAAQTALKKCETDFKACVTACPAPPAS